LASAVPTSEPASHRLLLQSEQLKKGKPQSAKPQKDFCSVVSIYFVYPLCSIPDEFHFNEH
jgi:hypothetical protein